MKEQILEIIDDKIDYYNRLSETKNGFEMACKGGAEALREIKKEIEPLLNSKES